MTDTTTITDPSSTTVDAGGGAGGGAPPAPFWEGFKSDNLKTHPSIQKFADPEVLADAYVNLEKRYGVSPDRRLDLPTKPEEFATWDGWKKLGVPEKVEGYDLKLPDTAPEEEKALVGDFVKVAHGANVPKAQADALFKWFTEKATAAAQAQQAKLTEMAKAGETDLRTEWGAAYEQRLGEVERLAKTYGDEKLAGELKANIGLYSPLAKMLGKVIERMAEPGAAGGQSGEHGAVEGGKLTPSQAKAEIRKIEADPAFRDKKNPQQKALVARRNELLQMAETAAA